MEKMDRRINKVTLDVGKLSKDDVMEKVMKLLKNNLIIESKLSKVKQN